MDALAFFSSNGYDWVYLIRGLSKSQYVQLKELSDAYNENDRWYQRGKQGTSFVCETNDPERIIYDDFGKEINFESLVQLLNGDGPGPVSYIEEVRNCLEQAREKQDIESAWVYEQVLAQLADG